MRTTAMENQVVSERSARAKTVGLWVLQLLLAANFLFAGGAKLAGVEPMVVMFDEIGMGQWFRFATGGLEVGGAFLLLVPRLASFAAMGLGTVMVGAVVFEAFVLSGSAIMPLVLAVLLSLIAFGRRREALAGRDAPAVP